MNDYWVGPGDWEQNEDTERRDIRMEFEKVIASLFAYVLEWHLCLAERFNWACAALRDSVAWLHKFSTSPGQPSLDLKFAESVLSSSGVTGK